VRPVRHASHARTYTDNILVRCVLENGVEGFGEGVPRDYVTGETIDSCLDLLQRSELTSQLESCRDFGQVVSLAERLRLAVVAGDDRDCQGNAARCALELALLDAYGKHFGQPLSAVVPLLAPEMFQPRSWVRYSGAILSAHGFKIHLAAFRVKVFRFQQIKVKVGIAGHNDVQRLKTIRRWLSWKKDIRVDVNEGWPATEVVQRIKELAQFKISAVEQPVAHADVDALAEIRRQVPIPIMLDESLCSRTDADRAIAVSTCDMFNLRLSKCGGFIATLRLAQQARRHGIGCQLGCQVGETALLSAAGRHFAANVGDLVYVEGSYDRHLVRESLGSQDITMRWGGWAPALSGPGLGVNVNPQGLERVTIRKEPLLG
jgi:muconate cycloisomerase